MKNLWLIIDNPKIEVKERMKAMNLIMHCYYMRSKLLKSEAINKEFLDYTKKVQSDEEANKVREQEISIKEKALQDYLDARKLTIGEFYNDSKKSEQVFWYSPDSTKGINSYVVEADNNYKGKAIARYLR